MAKPYHKNPRQITAKQYEALAVDLAELGDLGGIVHDLNSDEIIGGNQRGRVFDINACDVVLTEVLPEPDAQGTVAHGYVIWKGAKYAYRQVRWTPRQCERANIVANKRGGTWDFDILADRFEQDDLLAWGFEPFELGLGEDEPKPTGDTEAQTDRAEELRQLWNVQPGQLWQLGEHKLICGDCTDAATVARVMGGERASTLVSDPPYGIGYKYDTHDDSSNQQNQELIMRAWELGPEAKVWTCGLMNLVRDLAWNPSAKVLCWHKGFAQAGNGLGGASTWEPVLVVGVKGGTLPNDYLHFGTDRIEGLRDLHSCPKPFALFGHLIEHLAGEVIYEPFSGSGTTIIACENLGRRCRAVEISPAYVAVALQRWSDHTGKTPVLVE